MTHPADFSTQDLAAGIMGLTGPYAESLKRATRAIDAAISAAVQAEREACAKIATDTELPPHIEYSNPEILRRNIAAAIRARSNTK